MNVWQAALLVFFGVMALGGVLRLHGLIKRRRVLARIPRRDRVMRAFGLTLRILVRHAGVLPGMNPSKANRTRGDLVLANRRLLLVCNRGILGDWYLEQARPFRSARCTAPGRLVLIGECPRPHGEPGRYRIEIDGLEDALEWASKLHSWVKTDDVKEP